MNLRKARSVYLFGSGVSFILSVSLWFLGHKEEGIFVGVWVPSILSLGNLMLSTAKEWAMDLVNVVILIFGTIVAGSSLCVTCLLVRSTAPDKQANN